MLYDDDEPKRYVSPEEGRKEFPSGEAHFTCCVNCGALIFIDVSKAPFCNGRDTASCTDSRFSAN